MKGNTAFLYALRIWLCTLIVGSVLVVILELVNTRKFVLEEMIIIILAMLVYVGVHTLPAFLGLFLVFLALPTQENQRIVQQIIYGVIITLMIVLTVRFLLSTNLLSLPVVTYIVVAIATMLYFYPKGINIDTAKKDSNLLDAEL